MKFKFAPNYFALIIAAIIGSTLFKQIDFQYQTIENPMLAIIYLLVFFGCIFSMIKKLNKLPKNSLFSIRSY